MFEKYYILFKDMLGKQFRCSLMFFTDNHNNIPEPVQLTAGAKPCMIEWDGHEGLNGISTSKATVEFYFDVVDSGFINDINAIQYGDVQLHVIGDNFEWKGFVIPDEVPTPISNIAYSVKISAADVFSILKDKRLTDGNVYLNGLISFETILDKIYEGMPVNIDVTHGLWYDLKSKMIDAISLNDKDGHPEKRFNILEKLAKAFSLSIFYSNSTVYHRNLYNWQAEPKDIVIKDIDTVKNFFYDIDDWKYTQASKELANTISYGGLVGILRNGLMKDWTGNTLNYWEYDDPYDVLNIVKSGNGRRFNPIGAKIRMAHGTNGSRGSFGQPHQYKTRNNTYTYAKKGQILKIRIGYQYMDYINKIPGWSIDMSTNANRIKNYNPNLAMTLRIKNRANPDETKSLYVFQVASWYAQGMEEAGTANGYTWDVPATWKNVLRMQIAIESSDYVQYYETDTPPLPFDCDIEFIIHGLQIDKWSSQQGNYDLIKNNEQYQWIKITECLISVENANRANHKTEEDNYLSNEGTGKIEEIESISFGCDMPESAAGTIYNPDYTLCKQITYEGAPFTTQLYSLYSEMQIKRNKRKSVSLTAFTNEVQYHDLVRFKYQDAELLSGDYFIRSMRYNLKEAIVEMDCEELKITEKNFKRNELYPDILPDSTYDYYERHFNTR